MTPELIHLLACMASGFITGSLLVTWLDNKRDTLAIVNLLLAIFVAIYLNVANLES